MQTVHEKNDYSCEQGGHQCKTWYSLKAHIISDHEKLKDSCGYCDCKYKTKSNMKPTHEHYRYACNFCEYKLKTNDLFSSLHKNLTLDTEQCNFKLKRKFLEENSMKYMQVNHMLDYKRKILIINTKHRRKKTGKEKHWKRRRKKIFYGEYVTYDLPHHPIMYIVSCPIAVFI